MITENNKTTYDMIWRNKWLTSAATSIDDMIKCLEASITELRDMKADGLVGNFESSGDDYIWFTTDDTTLAEKYQMNEVDDEDDEEMTEQESLEALEEMATQYEALDSQDPGIKTADWGIAANQPNTIIT